VECMVRRRVLVGILILVVLLMLMVYSFQEYYSHDPQLKKYRQLFEDPMVLNNTVLSFPAVVESVDLVNQTIFAVLKTDPVVFPPVEISLGALPSQHLSAGDRIDVIGVVQGKAWITASELRVIEPWQTTVVYLRSLFAVPFVLYLLVMTWVWNPSTWCFDRRDTDA
jgi:hypothetical protein